MERYCWVCYRRRVSKRLSIPLCWPCWLGQITLMAQRGIKVTILHLQGGNHVS